MAESNIRIDRVGQQVGDYRLLSLLGGGGFGEVYLAEHLRNRSRAAVKILQARVTGSEELKTFINEARTFRLKHPNIVPLLDFGVTFNDVPYLVMEYASQGTLRERHPLGTRVPLPTVVSYVNQVASALQCAHDLYLIHRDVKPENMLVGANGEILLTDFGIAAVVHNSYTLNNQQEGIGGTISYMAPEQIEGKPRPASDQYALGVLTYEWLSGKRPFQGTPSEIMMQHIAAPPASFAQLTPMISVEVEQVVFTAMAKDPRQRFGSIQAFATALTQASQRHQPFSPPAYTSYPVPSAPSVQSSYPVPPPPFVQSSYPAPPPPPFVQSSYPASPAVSPLFLSIEDRTEATPPAFEVSANGQRVPHTTFATPWRNPELPQLSQRKGRSWGRIILFVILAAFIISGGALFAYHSLNNVQVNRQSGGIPPVATVTPTIAATPTAPDLQADPAGYYTWVTSRQPVAVQSFADTTLGWDTSGSCAFVNGNYQVSAQPAAGFIIINQCLAQKTNYIDFAYQVDLTMTRSETAGLIFRNNSVLRADYLFEVNANNTYFLNAANASLDSQNGLIPGGPTFPGKTTNTLTVIAHGHDIYLFINGRFLAHASDATSSSGQIGVFVDAQPKDQGGAIANFSNLKVWTLS